LLLPAFPVIIATTGKSAPAKIYEGLLPLAGAPLVGSASMPVARPGKASDGFTYWAHSTSTGSPPDSYRVPTNQLRSCETSSFMRLSVSPVGFIPDATNTSGNVLTNVSSVETIMCIVSFYIGYNYRDLIAALSIRSTLTDAPVASFTTRPLRATQHATGLMMKVAHFSHREAHSHHINSLTGHTWGLAILGHVVIFMFSNMAPVARARTNIGGHLQVILYSYFSSESYRVSSSSRRTIFKSPN